MDVSAALVECAPRRTRLGLASGRTCEQRFIATALPQWPLGRRGLQCVQPTFHLGLLKLDADRATAQRTRLSHEADIVERLRSFPRFCRDEVTKPRQKTTAKPAQTARAPSFLGELQVAHAHVEQDLSQQPFFVAREVAFGLFFEEPQKVDVLLC